MGLKYIANIFL